MASSPSSPRAYGDAAPSIVVLARACCQFNFCTNPVATPGATKCEFHKHRALCSTPDCYNQVYARGRCARHGGKRRCQNCDGVAQTNGYCVAHGGLAHKKFCMVEGCEKQAQSNKRCLKHGGGRLCKVPGCDHYVRIGGLCHTHHILSTNNHEGTELRCAYAYKPCPNDRAFKKDGTLHSLCAFHRDKVNSSQKKYNTKKRQQRTHQTSLVDDDANPTSCIMDPIPFEEVPTTPLDMIQLDTIVFDSTGWSPPDSSDHPGGGSSDFFIKEI
ncbi:hypothetical protein LEN26_012569 [Aphanomyces euteiches]|nr:hypothetical protein LEN26_012569 [Aphanomyces euteiches]